MNPTAARLRDIHQRIAEASRRSGRDIREVRLLAVAKTATADTLRDAWSAGQRSFAHNRIDRLAEHYAVLPEADWHVIGPLQNKKMRRAVEMAACIQTVGDLQTVERLSRRIHNLGKNPVSVLLQVNLTPQDGRYGVVESEAAALLESCLKSAAVTPSGLMTMAPQNASSDSLHEHFARLRTLAGELVTLGLPKTHELSMGMSEDFEIAIEEGATLVRVGRAIFPLSTP